MWRSDGTPAGTMAITTHSYETDPEDRLPRDMFAAVGSTLFYIGNRDGSPRYTLTKLDNNATQPVELHTFSPEERHYNFQFTDVNGIVFFLADDYQYADRDYYLGQELWKTDGTLAGTVLVKEITPGRASSELGNLVSRNGLLYFENRSDSTFWKSDGTPEGTVRTEGSILREYWANLPGSSIKDIPLSAPPTSTSQLNSLRTAANSANNYGQRIRGYLLAPATGSYTFFIQGDDQAELYLSPDSNPVHKQRIASAKVAWAWNVNPSQQSAPINLVAGQRYYLEVLHKEGSGGDQVRVGWRTPDMAAGTQPLLIPGSVLSPPPSISSTHRTTGNKRLNSHPVFFYRSGRMSTTRKPATSLSGLFIRTASWDPSSRLPAWGLTLPRM